MYDSHVLEHLCDNDRACFSGRFCKTLFTMLQIKNMLQNQKKALADLHKWKKRPIVQNLFSCWSLLKYTKDMLTCQVVLMQ